MLLALALLPPTVIAGAPESNGDERALAVALLDNAAAACGYAPRNARRDLRAANWSPYAPQRPEEPLSGLRAYWSRGAEIGGGQLRRFDLLRARISGTDAYLLRTETAGRGAVTHGCRLIAPTAGRLFDARMLSQWAGSAARQVEAIPMQVNETRWTVQSSGKQPELSVSFLDPNIPMPSGVTHAPHNGAIVQIVHTEIAIP